MTTRIEDYALIGDCETAALVGCDGSIDWLCWPRFDSGACFSALLGTPDQGRWKLSPVAGGRSTRRRYQNGTLILETEFETKEGAVTVVDFMPLREKHSNLVRIARCTRGQVAMRMELVLRFDYGHSIPWVTRARGNALRAIAGPNMVVFRTQVPHRGEDFKTVSEFDLKKGESVSFVLGYAASHLPPPKAIDPEKALSQTQKFWKQWTGRCKYRGPWADDVKRSLITLKALTYWPTGGLLAAPTTSLPEKLGGKRNWDYRFCWLRDAAFTLGAMMRAGYFEEASAWQSWLLRAVAGSPDQTQVLYGIAGERQLPEIELDWLPGYAQSKPVRIGNAASEQLQLDVYGEISAVMHFARRGGLPDGKSTADLETALLEHLEKIWREPDQGIWEVRGPRRHFTHSKVMAWLAFDRAVKSCEQFGLKGPVDRWRAIREEIREDVCRNGFNSEIGSFIQSYGSKNLDASLLMILKTSFLPVTDRKVIGTVRAIESGLVKNGFVLRYHTHEANDGLPVGEGSFIPCSFWLADAYSLMGRIDDAQKLIERLLKLQNDVGLVSEEYDPVEKRLLGNFPQAFSHVALLNSIFTFETAKSAAKKKAATRRS